MKLGQRALWDLTNPEKNPVETSIDFPRVDIPAKVTTTLVALNGERWVKPKSLNVSGSGLRHVRVKRIQIGAYLVAWADEPRDLSRQSLGPMAYAFNTRHFHETSQGIGWLLVPLRTNVFIEFCNEGDEAATVRPWIFGTLLDTTEILPRNTSSPLAKHEPTRG
jgi:hypothetical protein